MHSGFRPPCVLTRHTSTFQHKLAEGDPLGEMLTWSSYPSQQAETTSRLSISISDKARGPGQLINEGVHWADGPRGLDVEMKAWQQMA